MVYLWYINNLCYSVYLADAVEYFLGKNYIMNSFYNGGSSQTLIFLETFHAELVV